MTCEASFFPELAECRCMSRFCSIAATFGKEPFVTFWMVDQTDLTFGRLECYGAHTFDKVRGVVLLSLKFGSSHHVTLSESKSSKDRLVQTL